MALEGTLQDMSLTDLFQIFRLGTKTGVLALHGDDERGVIYVAEGSPIDAVLFRVDRSVVAAQEEAIIQMLLWNSAAFVFRHDTSVGLRRQRIVHDIEWIVIEGVRRREDPALLLPYHQLTMDTQLQLAQMPTNTQGSFSLGMEQWRVLSHVSRGTNLRQISETTGLAPTQVIQTAAELLAIGVAEVVTAPPPGPLLRKRWPCLEDTVSGEVVSQGVGDVERTARPPINRGLLDAIMRRVRGL